MIGTSKIFSVIALFLIISCSSVSKVSEQKIKRIATGEFSGKVEYDFSNDSTKVICIGDKKNMGQTFSFFVYSLSQNMKVSNTYSNVSVVKWVDNVSVKYQVLQGTVKKESAPTPYNLLKIEN